MALSKRALGSLAHGGVGFRKDVVEALAPLDALTELVRLGAQRVVVESFELRLQVVDLVDPGLELGDHLIVGAAEQLGK